MAESTLTLAYFELANEVSNFLGFPSDLLKLKLPAPAVQTNAQKQAQHQIDTLHRVMKSGLRQFYFPPPCPGAEASWDWSFLHPVGNVILDAGASSLKLPDDFGGFEGVVTIQPSTTLVWWPIQLRNEAYIRTLFAQYPQMTSRPMEAALTPIKGTTGNASNRWELLIFPTADMQYTLQFQYYVLPDYLSGAFPYAYGGAAHAETLLESCLAIAEQKLDDMSGVHTAKFMERLQASLGMDKRFRAQNLGQMKECSDNLNRRYGPFWHYSDQIGVNGIVY